MRKRISVIFLVIPLILIIFTFGFNIGIEYTGVNNLWDRNREGLEKLGRSLKRDPSPRLALSVITEHATYSILSLPEESYELVSYLKEKHA